MPSLVRPYFEGLLLALLAAGFFTLVGTGRMGTGVAIAGTLVLALRGWLLWRGRRPDLPPHWVTLTTLLYFLFYPVDVYLVSNSFIEATVHLVLFVAVVKLFTASQARDYVYLCVIAFLEVLAAATLTVGSDFFAFFSLFLLLTIATLVAFEAFRAEDRARIVARTDAPQFAGRLRASLFGVSAGLAGSVLLTGCLIFFMLPRMAHSYWHPNYGGARLTGFSDEVHLGEVGRLQQTNQTVMHIRALNPDSSSSGLPFAQPLLWRGRALSFFTGTSWLDPHRSRVVPTQSGTFQFGQLSIPTLPHHFLRYRISLEPIGSDVLFTTPQLREIDTRYANLGLDAAGTISTLGRSMAGAEYAATSDISIPPDRFLRNLPPGKPLAPSSEYLQLPQNLDPRIPELARSITRRQTSTIDRMRALEIYLRSHFRYTLKLEPTGPDPLADFMFRVKAGHCEYFASALAVMARSLGIPARVVNGFQMGQFNQVSGEYVVRGRDAHSWVEAYFPVAPAAAGLPTRGVWIPFDGTAGNPEAVAASWSRAMLYLDALQSFWQEWVINYDWAHQLNLAQRTQAGLHRNTENARESSITIGRTSSTSRKGRRPACTATPRTRAIGCGMPRMTGSSRPVTSPAKLPCCGRRRGSTRLPPSHRQTLVRARSWPSSCSYCWPLGSAPREGRASCCNGGLWDFGAAERRRGARTKLHAIFCSCNASLPGPDILASRMRLPKISSIACLSRR